MLENKKSIALSLVVLLVLLGCTSQPDTPKQGLESEKNPWEEPLDYNEQLEDYNEQPDSDRLDANTVTTENDETEAESTRQENEKDTEEDFERIKCSRDFSPEFDAGPYYEGELFDAHFHMPNLTENPEAVHGSETDPVLEKDISLEKVLCLFDKEKINRAVGFSIANPAQLEKSIETARKIRFESSGSIELYLMPVNLDTRTIEEIQESNPELFEGYGETGFYSEHMHGRKPDDAKSFEIYALAEKYSLPVMIHPGQGQQQNVENALKEYPNVTFILHGWESASYIIRLIEEYPNVYYTVDGATLFQVIYTEPTKERAMSSFRQNFKSMLSEKKRDWKSKIEKYPERFMWGSDRGYKWHYDEDVSILIEEFSRAFIGRLDKNVQKKYAYNNAEKLMPE